MMTLKELAIAEAERDLKSGDHMNVVLDELWEKARKNMKNWLGTSGTLSWGKVAEIKDEATA